MIFSKIVAVATFVASASAAKLAFRGGANQNKIEGAYFVELESGVDAAVHVQAHLAAQGVNDFKVRTTINNSFINAVSFSIGGAHDENIVASIPKAKDLFYVHKIDSPEPFATFEGNGAFTPEGIHSLTGVNEVRNKLGLTGKGVKVAIVDTGVFYTHAALGGGFGPGFKVSFGFDLVGDDYDASNGIVSPDDDPTDNCSSSSHGTHVAGIVGADARAIKDPAYATDVPFTGVAPEVTLGAYRVFGCGAGGTSTDIMTAAIYRAAADGADIINLSIGGGPAYSDSPDAVAATRVGEQGHFVFGSNGNNGREGIFAAGSPATAEGGFGVASFDNTEVPKPFITAADIDFSYNIGGSNGNFEWDKPYDIVINDPTADDLDKQDDGANDLPNVNATGKAMLIRWGDTAFGGSARRCAHAYKFGAVACLLYANTDSVPNIAGSPNIPSLATTREAGKAILAAVKAGKSPQIIVRQSVRMFNVPTGGTVSEFSSPGLDQDLQIKPDFGGIGGQVYSTVSKFSQGTKKSPYSVSSGTSMSSPYAAGVAALVLQAYGRNKPTFEELRTLLQNTASPRKKFGTDLIDSVAYQGAGLVNAYKAVMSKTSVSPSRLAFNDTQYTKQHYKLTVTNKNTVDITYKVKHQPALMVTPFTAGDDATLTATTQSYTADYATIKFSRNNDLVDSLEFTLKAGASRSFNVHVQPPANAIAGLFPVYSGYIVIGDSLEEKIASVPYAGVVGAWRDAQIWSRKSESFNGNLFQAKFGLSRFEIPVAENATASTGIYTYSSGFLPTAEGATIDGAAGAFLLPTVSTTSRIGRIEAIYKGKDWKSMAALGIKRETTLFAYSEASLPLNPAADGSLTPGGGGAMYFPTLQRNSFSQGQSLVKPTLYLWGGRVVTNVTDPAAQLIQLPEGRYQVRFTALKHFGRVNAPVAGNDYDTVWTPTFNLVYSGASPASLP
ncbi:hypothetical protein HDU67_005554 [Dinochytrium kinnereticum]|nr:hypothetical protein HDU67_005554 [Dinochytrium kinnereticum]